MKSNPLHDAVRRGKVEQTLIQLYTFKRNPYERDSEGLNSLDYAIQRKNFDLVRILSHSMKKQKQCFELYCCRMKPSKEMNQILLYLMDTFGNCIQLKNLYYYLHDLMYVEKKDEAMVKLLLKHYKPRSEDCILSLCLNSVNYSNRMFKCLVDHYPKYINRPFRRHHMNTLIQFTTLRNNLALTRYLLKKGASPNVCNLKLQFPIQNAMDHNNDVMIDLLLGYNANLFTLPFQIIRTVRFNHRPLIFKLIPLLPFEGLYEVEREGFQSIKVLSLRQPIEQFFVEHLNHDVFQTILSFLI
jgi:ankyrin repeat protein